ncbi:glutathione S-transferase family protein [Parablastomonas sp. CN1-191]|uniref:glutathione S-transferase family protein n=1 Tax=Parablastomonas sp. CN1-191 TaxID=3400908 RepID=UPI003BF7800C
MTLPVLYDFPRAPSPRRARIVLAEKGIAHDTVRVDLASGEQRGAAYCAINPAQTVPALRLADGTVLTDNAGIAAWAEAVRPQPPLLGRDAIDKAQVASWTQRIENEGLWAIAEAVRNSAPAMAGRALPGPHDYAQIPALAERGKARFAAFLDTLEAQLAGRDFVTAGGFSVADIVGGVALDFARVIGVDGSAGRPGIAAWRARLAERASFAL